MGVGEAVAGERKAALFNSLFFCYYHYFKELNSPFRNTPAFPLTRHIHFKAASSPSLAAAKGSVGRGEQVLCQLPASREQLLMWRSNRIVVCFIFKITTRIIFLFCLSLISRAFALLWFPIVSCHLVHF